MTTTNRELLGRVADTLTTLPYEAWNFGDSVAFEGMIAASDLLGDERWLRFAHGFFRAWATRARPYRRLDATAAGLAMVEVHERTGDPLVLEAAIGLASYLTSRPRIGDVFATWEHSPLLHPYGPGALAGHEVTLLADPPPGVFVDCLHFDPPFFVALGQAADTPRFVDEGVQQALGYVRLLQTEGGIFDHFVLEGVPDTFGPGWGRGQGWALLGLLDVVERLEADDVRREELAGSAEALIGAMVALQRDDGHWHAVVDDHESGDETSTAAFMGAAFRRAARIGLGDADQLRRAADSALRAALASTDEHGILRGVSAAVMACTAPSHYAHVPRDFVVPWGQGPLTLALAEALRDEDDS